MIAVGSAVVVVLLLIRYEADALFAIFGGILAALLLKEVAQWTSAKTKIPYGVTVAMIVIASIAVAVVMAVVTGPSLVGQAQNLAEQLPAAFNTLVDRIQHRGLLKSDSPPPAPEMVLHEATGFLRGSTEALGGVVVVFFIGLYGAFQPQAYVRGVLALVPPERRARAAEVLTHTGSTLTRWLIGRVVAMIFVGVTTTIGLHFLHVPLAFGLGVLAGLLAFVEYIGAVASGLPPMLLALASGGITRAVWVVVLFTGVHIIEGYVLTPALARKAVHFPPAFTLGSQVLFGSIFGVIGLTFATPTCVVIATVVQMLYIEDVLGERG
jgi:predicted PurR-regulated permease PerM